jgi:conjugal transfer ATP-binding protein TraC
MGFVKEFFNPENREFDIPSINLAQRFFKTHSFSEVMPYIGFDESARLFHNKKGLGFAVETLPFTGGGDEVQTQFNDLFQNLLPLGSNIQFLMYASPDISQCLEKWLEPRLSLGGMYEKLADRRADYLLKQVHDGSNLIRNFRLIISYSGPKPESQKDIENVIAFRIKLKNLLENFGVPVKEWQASDLINSLDQIINYKEYSHDLPLAWNPHQAISEQIVSPDTHIMVNPDELIMNDDYFLKMYRVRQMPSQWCLSMMAELIGKIESNSFQINTPFFLHYGVHIIDSSKTKSMIMGKCAYNEKQANSPIAKWLPSLKKQSAEWEFVRDKFEEGQRLVKTRFQIGLLGRKDNITEYSSQLEGLFRSQKWGVTVDSYTQIPSFLSMLPMSWGEGASSDGDFFKQSKMTLSHEPSNLLPIVAEWQGTSTPGMLLLGRRGQIFTWSPFDSPTNYNCCVVGRSGSGKSVFMQEMMTSVLGIGGRVFVLDVGRSFEKTTKLLSGQYLEFSTKSEICINPFSSIPIDDDKERDDALAMMKPVIALMASGGNAIDSLEYSFIERAIGEAWSLKQNRASITDIFDYLQNHESERARDLGTKIFPYTNQGNYGRFFEGESNISFEEALVVIELEELKERKDLQSVVVQIIIMHITSLMFSGDRKTPFHVVLDEAWDLLRGKQSKEFIETLARRLRKYKGSLVVGTQSVHDFYASDGARAAFENSDWMCLLSQKKESIDQLKESKKLSLDYAEETLLRSVHTQKGKYAEIMISGPTGSAIGRLVLDPFSKILYSTDAHEFSRVEDLQNQGMSLAEAVEEVSKSHD